MITEYLDTFFQDFNIEATITLGLTNKTIKVLFDESYDEMFGGDAEGRKLEVTCKSSDVAGVRQKSALSIGVRNFKIIKVSPDETDSAFTTLVLTEQGYVSSYPSPTNDYTTVTPFSWGDASPTPIYLVGAGQKIATLQVIITTAFDGLSPVIKVGDAAVPDRFIGVNEVDPKELGEYEVNPWYIYPAQDSILLTLQPSTSTVGAGYIVLEIT